MSTLYVDTINEKTSGNGVNIPGHVVQVVEGAVTGSSSTSSTTFSDTGLSASITPKSASNKILVRMDAYAFNGTSGHNNFLMLVRDTTPIGRGGTGTSNNDTASAFTIASPSAINGREGSFSISVFDSPATTSQVTYKIRFRCETGSDTAYFNYINNASTRPRSTITLMEIAQ